jgi:hypothetical protein
LNDIELLEWQRDVVELLYDSYVEDIDIDNIDQLGIQNKNIIELYYSYAIIELRVDQGLYELTESERLLTQALELTFGDDYRRIINNSIFEDLPEYYVN